HAVVDRLSRLPGVAAAGITSILPATGLTGGADYTLDGAPAEEWKMRFAMFATVYGDYFRVMGIPLLKGRYFTESDKADSLPVIILNDSMAKHCWPGQDAIGKRLHVGNPKSGLPWVTVVWGRQGHQAGFPR
ncbi:MAG TPA: ABC transporter permease, partial [Terriglobales bacterium]